MLTNLFMSILILRGAVRAVRLLRVKRSADGGLQLNVEVKRRRVTLFDASFPTAEAVHELRRWIVIVFLLLQREFLGWLWDWIPMANFVQLVLIACLCIGGRVESHINDTIFNDVLVPMSQRVSWYFRSYAKPRVAWLIVQSVRLVLPLLASGMQHLSPRDYEETRQDLVELLQSLPSDGIVASAPAGEDGQAGTSVSSPSSSFEQQVATTATASTVQYGYQHHAPAANSNNSDNSSNSSINQPTMTPFSPLSPGLGSPMTATTTRATASTPGATTGAETQAMMSSPLPPSFSSSLGGASAFVNSPLPPLTGFNSPPRGGVAAFSSNSSGASTSTPMSSPFRAHPPSATTATAASPFANDTKTKMLDEEPLL